MHDIRVIERLPRVNEDGISLKGCTAIHAPGARANEYSGLAADPVFGCSVACPDCYSPAFTAPKPKGVPRVEAVHANRKEFFRGGIEITDWRKDFLRDCARYALAIRRGIIQNDLQVLLSFHADMLQRGHDREFLIWIIENLHAAGLGHCILSKMGSAALAYIPYFRVERDCYAATVTGLDQKYLHKYERWGAPGVERIATLKAFYDAGFFCYASIEPVRDCDMALEVIAALVGCVDLVKIGPWRVDRKLFPEDDLYNYLKPAYDKAVAGYPEFVRKAVALCRQLGLRFYIKEHLQQFLTDEERVLNQLNMRFPHFSPRR
jgi:hypothetical protein